MYIYFENGKETADKNVHTQMYTSETHLGFTNMESEMPIFRVELASLDLGQPVDKSCYLENGNEVILNSTSTSNHH